MHIPFVDLRAQHDELRGPLETVIREVIDQSAFVGGERVEAFERQFAAASGARFAVACANGTDALKLALMAAGVRPGDEVVTVAHTFIATVEAITLLGAQPVFVDIDATYHLSPERLAHFLADDCYIGLDGRPINRHTGRPVTAVIPVHLYGLVADMAPLLELAARYRLKVVEDACQAHGATYDLNDVERGAGSLGVAGAFSFYPGKNLGGLGEGGAVTTNTSALDCLMRRWREHGQLHKYYHISAEGWNSRLDTLQCAVLSLKLGKLAEWNAQRRRVAAWYRERLADEEQVSLPVEPEGRRHVYHLFVVQVPNRDRLRELLDEQGIATGLHYPLPLHLQPAYQYLGWQAGDLPQTEAAAHTILSLPMYPHLTESQVDYVCDALHHALAGQPRPVIVAQRAA